MQQLYGTGRDSEKKLATLGDNATTQWDLKRQRKTASKTVRDMQQLHCTYRDGERRPAKVGKVVRQPATMRKSQKQAAIPLH